MSADGANASSTISYNFQNSNVSLNTGDTYGAPEPRSDEVPKEIDRVRRPIQNFEETKTYRNINKIVEKNSTLILHCYGIPGSGKSQIIRKLATKFPYQESNPKLCIKWHIQCKDSGHDIKEELKELAKALRSKHFLSTEERFRSVVDQLDKNHTQELIDALKECNVPVLIIVEDPPKDNKKLLQDLFRRLNSKDATDAHRQCFHVYITSRRNFAIFSEEEYDKMKSVYEMKNITGFNKKEAITYLTSKKEDEEAAIKVFNRFSGLPLGLQAAKGYCKSAKNMKYDRYLDLIKQDEYRIQEKEKEILKEYGENAEHVFQAIAMLFKEDDLNGKVLRCLSYLHYDRIPSEVIEKCFYILSTRPTREFAEADKDQLITKLMEYDMCTETDEGEVTFHEVVLNAFRLSHNPASDEQFNHLRKCVEIVSCIVSKDIRNDKNFKRMCQLRRHLQSLLENVKEEEKVFFEDATGNTFLLKSLVSRLYETAAVVMLAVSPIFGSTSGEYFQKALQHICGENEAKSLVESDKTNKQCEEMAKKVVKASLDKAKQLPCSFIQDYISKLKMHFDEKDLDFFVSRNKNLANIREELQSSDISYQKKLMEELRSYRIFLSETSHRDIFYCEKVASILHGWSRVILYADAQADRDIKKYMWLSSLSRQISIECRIECKVALLSEKLVTKSGLIPLLLKQKKNTENLEKAKSLCEEGLSQSSDNPDFYEDGLLKKVDVFTRILFLRQLVCTNYRLLAASKAVNIGEADEKCKELFNRVCHHLESMSNGLTCIIYCAKYYAVKKDFNEAIKCFNIYFEESQKSKPARFNVHAWAIYNYARMVNCGSLLNKDVLANLIEDALTKCKEILDSSNFIGADLRWRLQETVKSLENQQL